MEEHTKKTDEIEKKTKKSGGTGRGSGEAEKTSGGGKGANQNRAAEEKETTNLPEIEEQEIKSKPKREKKRHWRSRKKDKQIGAENAAVILSLVDGLAMSFLGAEAGMNEFEQTLIEEPLERMLGRIEWEIGEKLNRYTDPIMLALGLTIWGTRLFDIARERRADRDEQSGKDTDNSDTLTASEEDPAQSNFTPGQDDNVDLPMRTETIEIRRDMI